jgi:MFS family permease
MKMENNVTKLSQKTWVILILFGLFGRLAWAVENMYFNLFIYDTVAKSTRAVTVMVQASGIIGVIATLIMGTVSDKTGNRRHFLSIGYIIWGIVTMSFALISTDNVREFFHIPPGQTSSWFGLIGEGATLVVAMTILTIIAMDCVMTIFGSTANDAAFNAWVTDNTDSTNRARVESVLSVLPLLATLIIAGAGGLIVGPEKNYARMFYILGGAVTLCGVLGLFIVKDSSKLIKENEGNFFKNVTYGFRPETIKKYYPFYFTLLGILFISTATQVYFPYLIIYLGHYLGFSVMEYSAMMGVMISFSAGGVIFMGRSTEKIGRIKTAVIGTCAFSAGLFAMFVFRDIPKLPLMIFLGVSTTVMLFGYLTVLTVFGTMLRDYTPVTSVGKLQGVRSFFYLLIPMFVGPAIGDGINQSLAKTDPARFTYMDSVTNTMANVPAPHVFLAASGVALFIFIPIALIAKKTKNYTGFQP